MTERQGVEIDFKRRQAIPFITVAPGAIQLPKRPDRAEPSGRNPANGTLPLVLTRHLVPAVFLDRDGTLIEDRGTLGSPTQVVFYPETVPALRRLQARFRLFIVTHQSGVAKGELTLEEANQVNAHVVERLREHGVQIGGVYCCPHQLADHCVCIKPKPHFLFQAAHWHGLDLGCSWVIGDHPHDVEMARNAGATGIYVLTGHGRKHLAELRDDAVVASDLAAAADWIRCRMAGTAPPLSAGRYRQAKTPSTIEQTA